MLPCHCLDEGSMGVVVKLQVLDPDEYGILIFEVEDSSYHPVPLAVVLEIPLSGSAMVEQPTEGMRC